MHRTVQVALGGAALSLGAVVGFPAVALATTVCTPAQVPAGYSQVCITTPNTPPTTPPSTPPTTPVVGEVESPGSGGEAVGGGPISGGATGGGTASGGGTVSNARGAAASLPFTGDEILVLSIAGAAALAAGAALTVAGRRREANTA